LEQSEVLNNKPSTESELQAVELRDDAVDEWVMSPILSCQG
jgi:hypothetical protein